MPTTSPATNAATQPAAPRYAPSLDEQHPGHDSVAACPDCGGEGTVLSSRPGGRWSSQLGNFEPDIREESCDSCDGRGQRQVERCDRCHGLTPGGTPPGFEPLSPDGWCDCLPRDDDGEVELDHPDLEHHLAVLDAWRAAGHPDRSEAIADRIIQEATATLLRDRPYAGLRRLANQLRWRGAEQLEQDHTGVSEILIDAGNTAEAHDPRSSSPSPRRESAETNPHLE